ncbi:MAG TPA: DUF3137 domain-containing protein [Chitinophagales bacterium]|nr:DUF3137 domain-containing protein [Chitinophagales bacterium]
MKSPEEFDNYYKTTLVPILELLEHERKKVAGAFWKVVFSILLFIPVILLSLAFKNPWLFILLLAPIFFAVKNSSEYSKRKRAYVQHFKEEVITGLVKTINEELSYYPQSLISQYDYCESDLFRSRIDSYSGGDLVEGKIVLTNLAFSELHHREKREYTDNKGIRHTHWVTIFKGIFFIADFNKNFRGRTYVLPESGFDFLGVGTMLERWFEGRGDIVKLENPVFEKFFKVFSNDQIEARYIISPSLMERLVEFREKVKNRIYVSFIHSKVFIAIPLSKNLFEPNEFSSGVKSDYLREYLFYLTLVTDIVDDLNLNTRIWTKQ